MFPHFPFMFFLLCSLLSSSLCSHLFWYSQLFLLPFFLLYCQLLKFLHHQCFSFVIPHWLLSLFFLFSLWPSFIFTYSLFLPPLLLCKVVAVCLKSGLIELRSGESTATSILHTHTEIHAHTDTNTSSFSLCSSINAVSPTGTEVDAHIHTLLSHQLRVCIDLSLQQWCLFGFYIVFCSSSYISVYDPNTHTNTATHAQTHTARYTHRYTHLCNIISFVVSEHFL